MRTVIASHVYSTAARDSEQALSVVMEKNSSGCMVIVTLIIMNVFRDSIPSQELESELQFHLDVSGYLGTCR